MMSEPTPFNAFFNNMASYLLTSYHCYLCSKLAEIPPHRHTGDVCSEGEHHQDNDRDYFVPYNCIPDTSKANTNNSTEPLPAFMTDKVVPSDTASSSDSHKSKGQSKDISNEEKKSKTVYDRFKPFHEEKWSLRYKELKEFVKEHGHGAVPHKYPKNPQLGRWVKRQRRQYKLYENGKISTMTKERLDILNQVGFVWDAHEAAWKEKVDALKDYRRMHGNSNVSSTYEDKKLAMWVKCQRRQYKLYWQGKASSIYPERICELEELGFEWEVRANQADKGDDEDHILLQQNISDF